jgi:hypothetical protein
MVTAASSPKQRARRQLRKKVGEPVDVRLSKSLWTTFPKPCPRRGKNYRAHVQQVLFDFEQAGIPATKGNLRRVAAGRGPRLRSALAQIAANAGQDETDSTVVADASMLHRIEQL